MSNSNEGLGSNPLRLILVPGVITLAVTLLRLTGELRHWSEKWFSSETGGVIPHGASWVIGITWLAAIFGIYFALKLARGAHGPRSLARAAIFAGLGVVIFLAFEPVVVRIHVLFNVDFPQILIFTWFFWILAGVLQYFGWPELFKVLLVYAYAARIPVAIVMFFAMLGQWGTHYDYVGTPLQSSMSLIPRFFWLAFFPQLVGWVGFTITLGAVAGILALAISRLSQLLLRQKVISVDVS
jgi:hypothetical protein